jgi:hypothetical protein
LAFGPYVNCLGVHVHVGDHVRRRWIHWHGHAHALGDLPHRRRHLGARGALLQVRAQDAQVELAQVAVEAPRGQLAGAVTIASVGKSEVHLTPSDEATA